MKWITNNISLNMVDVQEPYTLTVNRISETIFKEKSISAENRMNQIDICQELSLSINPGNVSAKKGDSILTAQYLDGEIIFREVIIGDTQ